MNERSVPGKVQQDRSERPMLPENRYSLSAPSTGDPPDKERVAPVPEMVRRAPGRFSGPAVGDVPQTPHSDPGRPNEPAGISFGAQQVAQLAHISVLLEEYLSPMLQEQRRQTQYLATQQAGTRAATVRQVLWNVVTYAASNLPGIISLLVGIFGNLSRLQAELVLLAGLLVSGVLMLTLMRFRRRRG